MGGGVNAARGLISRDIAITVASLVTLIGEAQKKETIFRNIKRQLKRYVSTSKRCFLTINWVPMLLLYFPGRQLYIQTDVEL